MNLRLILLFYYQDEHTLASCTSSLTTSFINRNISGAHGNCTGATIAAFLCSKHSLRSCEFSMSSLNVTVDKAGCEGGRAACECVFILVVELLD